MCFLCAAVISRQRLAQLLKPQSWISQALFFWMFSTVRTMVESEKLGSQNRNLRGKESFSVSTLDNNKLFLVEAKYFSICAWFWDVLEFCSHRFWMACFWHSPTYTYLTLKHLGEKKKEFTFSTVLIVALFVTYHEKIKINNESMAQNRTGSQFKSQTFYGMGFLSHWLKLLNYLCMKNSSAVFPQVPQQCFLIETLFSRIKTMEDICSNYFTQDGWYTGCLIQTLNYKLAAKG